MNEKELRYSIMSIFLLFFIIVSFPIDYIIKKEVYLNIIHGLIRIICSIYLFIYLKRKQVIAINNERLTKKVFLLLPFILAIINNLILLLFVDEISLNFSLKNVVSEVIFFTGVAMLEEIVFRGVIFNYYNKKYKNYKQPLTAIIISSILFGLVHLLNIFHSNLSLSLMQVGYSFLMGLLFAFIYAYTNNIILCGIVHFMYNFCNETLFLSLMNNDWNIVMYGATIINIIILLIYGIILYKYYFINIKQTDEILENKARR